MLNSVDVFYRAFGDLLRQARKDRFTQTQLGRRVGLSRASIANIEVGRQRVPLHMIDVFARELDLEPCALLPKGVAVQDPVPADQLARVHPEVQGTLNRLVTRAREERRSGG
jgi:transcriptional regulator with XRE-family HTH domain